MAGRLAVLAAVLILAANAQTLTNVSAASYKAIGAAPGSLVAGFGTDLGTTVLVRDSAGVERRADPTYVSPGQVNYLVPEETALGPAVVRIGSSEGPLLIQRVAPGLFAANGDGKGVAAATAIRVDGVQTPIPAVRFDTSFRRHLTAPMDLSTGRVYVSLYGTGIRHAETVTVTVGGVLAPVHWKGAHSVYPGLDQVNIELPPSLTGRGTALVALTADGVRSNTVTLEILDYQYLNLGFETLRPDGRPWYWMPGASGYEYATDDTIFRSGARSMRIRDVSGSSTPALYGQYFPLNGGLERARGRRVRLSGYLRTGLTGSPAGVWMHQQGVSGMLSFHDADCSGGGRTEWQECVLECEVNPAVTGIGFGVFQTGAGTSWFDDLSLQIDGAAYLQAPPMSGEPSAAQVEWVRNAAKPFLTPDAGSGFDDLTFVKDLVGDARIVALGEGTHGTREFFRMKHRLLEYLATEMGFAVFSIEASMPEAYRLNDYVLNGVGDPRQLLKGMYFWTWNTQEVLDMIEWMREFNESGRGRLQFTGFDMQYASVAIENVLAFVTRADPAMLRLIRSVYAQAADIEAARRRGASVPGATVASVAASAREIWQYLQAQRSSYLAGFSAREVDWAIQNARIVEQATYVVNGGSAYRDACMAENFNWILDHNPPGTKAVI